MTSIYQVNKGINKSIEFRGLRAQYIWYFGGMVIILLTVFAVLYIAGTGTIICFAVVGGGGSYMSIKIFGMSRRYGEYGLMKALAKKQIPKVLKSYTRKTFQHFSDKEETR